VNLTLVRFALGEYHCALALEDVSEVLRVVAVTPLPVAPAFVEGVINRRGVVTPVIDLRKRVGLSCGPYDNTTRILITSIGGHSIGVIVDEVSNVVVIDEAGLGIDPSEALGMDLRQYSSRVVRDGTDLVVVIDPEKMLTADEEREFEAAVRPQDEAGW
jgi:purine-binding chemotaxis protein CheW